MEGESPTLAAPDPRPEALAIRAFDPADRESLLALHRESFLASGEETYTGAAQRFEKLLDVAHTLVAVRGARVVGFVAFEPLDEDPRARTYLARSWLWARAPERAERIHEVMRRRVPPSRRDAVTIRHFLAPADAGSAGAPPGLRDLFVTDVAVDTSERRGGVGTALIRELLLRARSSDVPRVWVTAWRAGAGATLFEHCGFVPLIEIGPWYSDGTSTRLGVRDLVPRDPGAELDHGYPGQGAGTGGSSVLGVAFLGWILVRGLADRATLGDPLTTATFCALLGALAVRAFDRGQRLDRARGLTYRVAATGLEEWRGKQLARSFRLEPPASCALAAPPVTSSRGGGAVALRLIAGGRSMVVGPLAVAQANLLAEEMSLHGVEAVGIPSFIDSPIAGLLYGALGVAAVLGSVVVPGRALHAVAASASALVAAYAVRRSLRWNDGSPRALWPLMAVPLLGALLWLGLRG